MSLAVAVTARRSCAVALAARSATHIGMAEAAGGGGGGGAGAPAAAAGATASKSKNPVQKTLYNALGKAPPLPKPGFVADGAAASVHATAVDMAKQVVAAAAAGKPAPPRAAVPGFINDKPECESILLKGTKKVVEVFRLVLPPLEYWRDLGKVRNVPTQHPPYVGLGCVYVRKDGIKARADGEADMVCAKCFEPLKSPSSGHSNITDPRGGQRRAPFTLIWRDHLNLAGSWILQGRFYCFSEETHGSGGEPTCCWCDQVWMR